MSTHRHRAAERLLRAPRGIRVSLPGAVLLMFARFGRMIQFARRHHPKKESQYRALLAKFKDRVARARREGKLLALHRECERVLARSRTWRGRSIGEVLSDPAQREAFLAECHRRFHGDA